MNVLLRARSDDCGHGGRAAVSSLLFVLMHTTNLLAGMELETVAVLYTFCFGMCTYLAVRVTGTIWVAIVLHGLTGPSTFLATGGIDEAVGTQDLSGWSALASVATFAFVRHTTRLGILSEEQSRSRRVARTLSFERPCWRPSTRATTLS